MRTPAKAAMKQGQMTDHSLLYTIGITRIKGIGPTLAKNLIAYTGSPESIFTEKGKTLEKIPGIGRILAGEIINQRTEALKRAEREVDFIQRNNLHTYYFNDKTYPCRLKECPDSPILLFGRGDMELNSARFISIVGTRKATETGKENCRKLVDDIAQALPGAVIVSGLAYGVDVCAHKAAVEAGLPTIGVLAHGLDTLYPAVHSAVASKMVRHGGLLTEFPSGTNPDRPNFVQRNRIVAGMCDALIVVESHRKGGALITAELANGYNRDVFAFPGRVADEASAGCNRLIKQNKAILIESADDLIQCMNWGNTDKGSHSPIQTSLFSELSEEEESALAALNKYPDGLSANELAMLTSRPFSQVSSLLLGMEFKGVVKSLPGNIYKTVIGGSCESGVETCF